MVSIIIIISIVSSSLRVTIVVTISIIDIIRLIVVSHSGGAGSLRATNLGLCHSDPCPCPRQFVEYV